VTDERPQSEPEAGPARRLGRLATGISLGCGLVVLATVGALAMPAIRARLGLLPASPTTYAIGERIDVPAEAYAGFRRTLLIVARPDCAACRAARPFFQRLTAALRERGTHVVVIAPGRDHAADVAYAHDVGVDEQNVVVSDLSRLHIRVVPSLFVVDGTGALVFGREGSPPAREQDALSQRVTSAVAR